MNTKRTVVFDLDGSLETPYYDESQSPAVQAWMKDHTTGYDFDELHVTVDACEQSLPHFILPGTFELLRWVHDHGFEIVFFSNAVAERNQELCPVIMERAFGKDSVPPYRILSREDCVDTEHMYNEEKRASYQGLWHGNYKKKLADVVVPAVDLPNTLMIEDDNSYACKGEEQNFVYGVYGGCAANYLDHPQLSSKNGHDFHLPFYFCGLLKRILDTAEQTGVSLADASRQVQYEDYGWLFPADGVRRTNRSGGVVNIPNPPQDDYRVYLQGLNELRTYNPDLGFWTDGEEEKYYWPTIQEAPVPPPEPPKPKAKTDMTMDEANYWMGVLREVLCGMTFSNIKHVGFESKDFKNSPYGGEGHPMRLRHPTFNEDGDYFDIKEVTHVRLYGYLPAVPRKREKGDAEYLGFENENAKTARYEDFRNVIRKFLEEIFGVYVEWHKLEVSNYGETWEAPVCRYG